MKRLVIVSIMILAAAAVFATGAQEVNEDGVVELERGELARNSYLEDLNKVEVRGVVKYESPAAELVSGGKDYTLIAPGARMLAGYLAEGQRITVNGYILEDDQAFGPGMGRDGSRGGEGSRGGKGGRGGFGSGAGITGDNEALEDNIRLLVESVEIDGTVYQLPWVNGDGSGQGRGQGRGNSRMQGQGRGYYADDCPYYN